MVSDNLEVMKFFYLFPSKRAHSFNQKKKQKKRPQIHNIVSSVICPCHNAKLLSFGKEIIKDEHSKSI